MKDSQSLTGVSQEYTKWLSSASRSAAERCYISSGERPVASVELVGSEAIVVELAGSRGEPSVTVSSSVVCEIHAIWLAAGLALGIKRRLRIDYVHQTLEWLILHELMHVRLDHLSMLGTARLVEVGDPEPTQPQPSIQLEKILTPGELPKARLCLELQADNDASDIMFGPFGDADWRELRSRIASVVVIMALIERENARSRAPGITHPKASTRFFQLLAQVSQFWLYEDARLETDGEQSWVKTNSEPDPERFRAYRRQVLEPAILDAVTIAEAAGAEELLADLRAPLDLLSDVFEIQTARSLEEADLKTAAARQWRELLPINEKILIAMGHRD